MPRRGLDTEQVVEQAIRIADAEGLEAVTLARVAAELGVRAPSLYNHIDGRDALIRAISLRAVRELTDALRAAAVGRSGADALTATAVAYRDYARAHPGRYATSVTASRPGDEEHAARGAEAVGVLLDVLRAWNLEGEEAIHTIRAIRSALHGFVSLEAAGGFGMPLDLDDSFAHLLAVLAGGLGTPAS